ncbi:MAG: cytochrome b/b6 domain-containing protein [Gammaproteobacteria bacterium]
MNSSTADTQQWGINVRIVHLILACTVTFQLFSSLCMADPGIQFLFPIHEFIGLVTAGCVLAFWWLSIANHDLRILLPWNRAGVSAILHDIGGLLHGRLPVTGKQLGLSGFVHGLGLLALTGSSITGFIIYFYVPMAGHVNPADSASFTRWSLDHKFFGELLWIYWFGHVGFAILHQILGKNIIQGIFNLNTPADTSDHPHKSKR